MAPQTGAAAGFAFAPSRGCYLIGQPVPLQGNGFAANRPYSVSTDGVFFGISRTSAQGTFSSTIRPGGLYAGQIQEIDQILATDGTSTVETSFTLTRRTGARFLAGSGDPGTLRAPFEVWGFALDGRQRSVYLHYVSPAGHPRTTLAIGDTGGQCGFLRTPRLRFFPFLPSAGDWTLQLDTHRRFSPHVRGPMARIHVLVRRA